MTVSTDAYFCFICSSFSSAMSPPNEHRAALVSWARSIEWMPGAGIDYVCFTTLAPGRLDRCAHGGEPFGFALPGAGLWLFYLERLTSCSAEAGAPRGSCNFRA